MKRTALGYLLIAVSVMAATTLMAAKQKSLSNTIKPSTEVVSSPTTATVPGVAPSSGSDIAATPKADQPAAPTPVTSANPAASYAIDWYSINGGGTIEATSPSYKMGSSVGQSVAGEASSPSYAMGIGFWYGAGGCACAPCHHDPTCDGIISDVQDVVATVAVAFRGVAAVQDPSCPKERTDFNCDGFTDVQDVVAVVSIAFRGGNPATTYCDPCA